LANPFEGRLLRRDDGDFGAGAAEVDEGELAVLAMDQAVALGEADDVMRENQTSAKMTQHAITSTGRRAPINPATRRIRSANGGLPVKSEDLCLFPRVVSSFGCGVQSAAAVCGVPTESGMPMIRGVMSRERRPLNLSSLWCFGSAVTMHKRSFRPFATYPASPAGSLQAGDPWRIEHPA